VLDIPTATLILTAGVACVTSYIAIQQWLTAKRKLRLDVFDRRLPVFEATMRLTEIVVSKEKFTLEEIQEFKFATKSVQFLFDQQMARLLRQPAQGSLLRTGWKAEDRLLA
jgi:hypothetical protein